MAGGAAAAAAVLACRDLDEARARHPQVVEAALRQGPGEAVFRAHWAPGADYHESLRTLLAAVAVQTGFATVTEPPQKDPFGAAADALDQQQAAAVPRAAAEPPEAPSVPTEQVRLQRTANGDFWGFCCNKDMKIVLVNDGSPASRAGLKRGLFVVEASGKRCVKPSDAYGPDRDITGMLALDLVLTKTKVGGAPVPLPVVQKEPENYDQVLLPSHLRDKPGARERSRDRDTGRDGAHSRGDPGWDKGWPAVRVKDHPWPVCELPPPGTSPAADQHVGGDLAMRLVFLCMGSSNMAGRTRLSGDSYAYSDRAFMLNAKGRWVPATEPVNPHDGRGDGAGPQLAFAHHIVKLLPKHAGVCLVPCACGGTKADDWEQGKALFAATVKRAKLGAEACNGIISGVIWHLGEEDAANESYARLVGSKTVNVCHAIRTELGIADLPFIVGQLYNSTYSCHLINASYNAMAGEKMDINTWTSERGRKGPWSTEATHRVRCASSDGLASPDKAHFDMKSMTTLGKRYADLWWNMEGHNFPDQAKMKGLAWGGGD